MAHIFLSYSRNDGSNCVSEIQNILEDQGYKTWRDVRDRHFTKDFTVDLEEAIKIASHVVVCITPDTKRSTSFVPREIQYALALNKPVIPLRCTEMLPHISIINNDWVDYFKDKLVAIKQLFSILSREVYDNRPGDLPDDPFKDYLQRALIRINEELKVRVVRQLDLHTEATPDAVKTAVKLPDIFEQFFSGVKVETENSEKWTHFKSFSEAFHRYKGRVLLLGEPGAGKTITLMAYARFAITARLEDPNQFLPLLGLIPTWDAEKQPLLCDWLAEIHHLDKIAVQNIVDQGRALLLLDGLDELGRERFFDSTKASREKYDPRIRFIHALPHNNQILITSRVEDYDDVMKQGKKIELNGAVTLQPLDDAQMAEYLTNQPELWKLIQKDKQLNEIARTPLLMYLFAHTYENDIRAEERNLLAQLGDARELRDRIFLSYLVKRYEHESRKGNSHLEFSLDSLMQLIGMLAMANAALSHRWASANILHDHDLERVLPANQIPAFIALTLRLNILLPVSGGFRFVHLLLRDVLAYKHSMLAINGDSRRQRRLAAAALGNIRDARAGKPLIAALQDEDVDVRYYAAYALGEIGVQNAIKPLMVVLTEDRSVVQLRVTEALGIIGHPNTIASVTPAINDMFETVRSQAAIALGRIGDKQAAEALITALRDEEDGVRYYCTWALGEIKDVNAVPPLIALMNERLWDIRRAAIIALSQIGESAVEPLINALSENQWRIYTGAVDALTLIKDSRAVEPLISLLDHHDADMRCRVAQALGQIKDSRAVKPLINKLQDGHSSVRDCAATALEKIGTSEALIAVKAWRYAE